MLNLNNKHNTYVEKNTIVLIETKSLLQSRML